MKVTFLGTGAAEGWPAPFCRCPACNSARKNSGKDIRSRTGALIDGVIKIDFSADTVSQLQRYGLDLCDVHSIIFTHEHSDHLVPSELEWLMPPFTNTPMAEPLDVYGNGAVHRLINGMFQDFAPNNLTLKPVLSSFEAVVLVDGTQLLPLAADHIQDALLLRITRPNGKSVFWGHDSGRYPASTVAALGNAGPVDMAVIDCTFGGQTTNNRGHLGIDGVVEMVDALRCLDVIVDATTVIATHFSHNGALLHDQLVDIFSQHGIHVAYDGVVYEV